MKVLVTGAQGFIGRYVVGELLRQHGDCEVLGAGRSPRLDAVFTHVLSCTPPAPAPLPAVLAEELRSAERDGRYRYTSADLCDPTACARLLEDGLPDSILHLASGLRGDHSVELVQKNVGATAVLLQAICECHGPKPRVVLGSSGGVYGRFPATDLPLREGQACDPADVYSATKLAAEQIGRVLGRTGGVPVVTARIFNVVGPGQDERHVAGRFAAALRGCAAPEQVLSVGALEPTRDFIDVRDVASALVLLADRGAADTAYNVASGEETAIGDVLRFLLECCAVKPYVQSKEGLRAGDVPRHCADISAIKALGFAPQFPLRTSLADLYAYYQNLDC